LHIIIISRFQVSKFQDFRNLKLEILKPEIYFIMRTYFFIFIVLLFSILSFTAQAQQESAATGHFFQKLARTDSETGGSVKVFQDSRIDRLFESMRTGVYQTVSMPGFRVQVYSSNVQKTAKDEAYKLEKDLKAAFPEYAVYVIYESPSWKVRLGDFKTKTEANAFLSLVVGEFPSLKNYTYVVQTTIKN